MQPSPSEPGPAPTDLPKAPALGTATLVAYSLPGIGMTFVGTLVFVQFAKFAVDVLLVAPAAVGLIFGLGRLWDAVSDPVAGYWSDRSANRLGRRRSWMLVSCAPIVVFTVMLWGPPRALEGPALLVWLAVAVFGFYSASTIFEIPHAALGAELTDRQWERNRVFGFRQAARAVGLLGAFGVGMEVLRRADDPRTAALWLAVVTAAATVALIAFAVARVAERPEYAGRGAASPIAAFRDVGRNPHARLLLVVFFIETLGLGGIGVLTPFVIQYVMKVPELTTMFLLAYVVPQMLSIPLWVVLARRFQKRRLWLVAMCLSGIGFGGLIFVGEGAVLYLIGMAVLAGTAGGCGSTIGPSIQADVIDYDEYQTGERKEGAYFAAWNFVAKSATGAMVVISGLSLQWVGFEPNAEQSELTKNALRVLYGGLPFFGFAVGVALFSRFSLTEEEHARMRRVLDARG